ncbi:MAG: ribonuclease P protein component [Desulfobulbaceae bacterium]|nr:ribonuclease P protein component [Desulfobulbaceae bacterium]
MGLSLPKDSLLTKSWQYQKVYKQGKRTWDTGITLVYIDNDQGQDRLGISISGQKLAVRRNRIKRLIKEFYRHNRNLPSLVANRTSSPCCVDMVIATNQKFHPRCLADIQNIFARHIGRAICCASTEP